MDRAMVVISRPGPDLTATQIYNILQLRSAVFVVEQTCPFAEIDGLDLLASSVHLWVEDSQGIRSYLRVLTPLRAPDLASEHDQTATAPLQITRVVTRVDQRGQGLSAVLINSVHEQWPTMATKLEAQSHLSRFYERLGYGQAGPEFLEDGIPHIPMARTPA